MDFGTSPMVLFLICDWNGDTGDLVIEVIGEMKCHILKEEGVPRDTLLKYGEFSKVEQLYAYTVGDGDATGAETYTLRSAVNASASQGVVVINLREGRSKTDTLVGLSDLSQRSYTLVTPRADNPIPMKLLENGMQFFSKVQPEIAVESLAELHAIDFKLVIGKGVSLSFTTSQKNEEKFQRIDIKFIGFDADELVVIQLKGGRYLLATSNEYLRKLIHFGGRDKNYLMLSDMFRTVGECTDRQGFGIMAGSVSNIRSTGMGLWSFRIFRLQKFTLDTASGILNVTANISVKPLVSRSRLVTIGLSSSMDNSLWASRYSKSNKANRAKNENKLRAKISGMNFGTSPMVLFLICDWNGDTGDLVIEVIGEMKCVILKEEGVPRDTLLTYGEFSKVEQLYAYTVEEGDATGAETYTLRSAVNASASQGVVVINLREGRSKTDTLAGLSDLSQRSYTLVTPRADNPIPMKLLENGMQVLLKGPTRNSRRIIG